VNGKSKEIEIRDLFVGKGRARFDDILEAHSGGPKVMIGGIAEFVQHFDNARRIARAGRIGWAAADSDKPILGERAGGPTRLPVISQPLVTSLVVHMLRIENREKNVHIQ
jgi:hypothetical protein